MDCLDNERRPHFPQFSYSASGREWTVQWRHHQSWSLRSSTWDPKKRKNKQTNPPTASDQASLRGFFPSPSFLLSSSPLQSAFFIYYSYFCQKKTNKQKKTTRPSDPNCDLISCDDPLRTGAPPERAVFWRVSVLHKRRRRTLVFPRFLCGSIKHKLPLPVVSSLQTQTL